MNKRVRETCRIPTSVMMLVEAGRLTKGRPPGDGTAAKDRPVILVVNKIDYEKDRGR